MISLQDPKISVIIVNYNGRNLLRRCVSSVLDSKYPSYEIIVVDNGSSDGSVKLIEDEFGSNQHRIFTLALKQNLGFSAGNQLGADKAKGKYLMFLNNDTKMDPSCLGEMVKIMEKDASIGVAQPKTLFMDRKDTFDSAGGFLNVTGFENTRGHNKKDVGQYNRLEEITWAAGAAMIVRKNVWTSLNGFDPLFFAYFEDTDFCWRTWLYGYRVLFVPYTKVFHVGSATSSKFGHKFMFQEFRNRLVMVVKNLSLKNLAKYSPLLVAMTLIRLAVFVSKHDSVSLKGAFHGIIWCIRYFRCLWIKRLAVQKARCVSDSDLLKKGILSTLPLARRVG
jgi:GT2 family glycosyltransferase